MAIDYWMPVTLSELIDIKHGFAFMGEFIRDNPPGDILLTPGNFAIGGGFKDDKFKYYTGPVPIEYVLEEGDLLVTMTDLSKNGDTLGYPAFVPRMQLGRYLHNQRLGKILIRTRAPIRKDYLYFLFCSRPYRNEVLASATGTTVKHTSPERIKTFKFLMPPPLEQKNIAHILGTFNNKIESNRQMNNTLEAVARALFKSWFVDFDPVHAKMEGRQLYGIDAETAALFPDSFEDSQIGEIPRGWIVKSLDQIADFLNGLALQNYLPSSNDDYLPIIKIAELRRGMTELSGRASTQIEKKYIVEDGDVIFSWSGSLEVLVWCGGRGALNQHLFKVTSIEYPKWFYYHWIEYHLPEFQAIAAGKATTMGHIQRHHLREAHVLIPSDNTIHKLDQIMSPMLDRLISNNVENRTLMAIRDLLLPKLLSGEIRVKDAEKFVEIHI